MANIRIDLNHAPLDGETVSFKAPCHASDITGMVIYYPNDAGARVSREFTLNDANGGDIGLVDNIFAEGAIVKVILDTDASNAFVQNPDTNTYLEGRFDALTASVATAQTTANSKIAKTDIVQSAGTATNKVMSQKAVTDAILHSTAPDYVVDEAKAVANGIIEKRSINSLVLLMAADIHVSPVEATRTAIKHMGQGMDEIRKYITPDAVVLLGDYNYGVTPQSTAQGIEDMKLVREYVADATNGVPTIWMNGNHDYYGVAENEYRLSENMVYALVGSHNTANAVVDVDNLVRNYGYVDFEKQRIRLIYLNTTDINGVTYTSYRVSNEQGAWFINTALDLSSKGEDEKNWGVVVCTHIPAFSNAVLTGVLCDYKDKTGGSAYGVSYSFANVKAQIIGTFHGHIHNLKVTDMITEGGKTIKAICIPNAVPGRENPYTGDLQEVDANGNPVSYPKTAGTADDTSFCAVVIDRDNHKIHAVCYGAGYDREIDYSVDDVVVVIVNQIPISTDASGAVYNGTGYKDGVRLGSDGADRTGAATDATGFIPCTPADTLYFKNCQIAVLGGSSTTYQSIGCYDSEKKFIKTRFVDMTTEMTGKDYDVDASGYLTRYNCADLWSDTAFVRVTGNYIGADSIITVSEPIED